MRVLCIADEESRKYYDFYRPGVLDEFDLIISCGDLNKRYLEFLVTMAHCPLIYVHGNHDDRFLKDPPEGCICIENEVFEYKGIRFLGLGGSYRYTAKGKNMYTEKEMHNRIFGFYTRLKLRKGFDVLVTHAPARGLGDLDDLPHRGFECFVKLLDRFKPSFMIHGHVHMNYGHKIPRVSSYNNTTIINAFECYVLDIPDVEMAVKK